MPGSLVHFELPSRDTARARDFWSGVLGWTFNDPGMPGVEYWMTKTGENQGGAILESDGPLGIVVYFETDDIEASIAKVREHGGTSDERHPIPGVGWFTHCKDTEGNDFSLFESDQSVQA